VEGFLFFFLPLPREGVNSNLIVLPFRTQIGLHGIPWFEGEPVCGFNDRVFLGERFEINDSGIFL